MNNITQGYNDRTRFILQNSIYGNLVIIDPIGWDSDQKELARHSDYHGIFPKFSNNLKFIENGYSFIKTIYETIGLNADLRLIKEVRDPKTDIWVLEYAGYLDMSTYIEESKSISIKFNSGGLEATLKARESSQIEITRKTSIDGVPLTPLKIDEVELEGRRIFLKTDYEVKNSENYVYMNNQTNGQTRGSNYPIPLKIINKSHEEAQSPVAGTRVGDDTWERYGSGETGLMFFAVSERQRSLRVKFKLSFISAFNAFDDINYFTFYVRVGHYGGGSNYSYKNSYFLFTSNDFSQIHYQARSFTFDQVINLDAGDSLSLEVGQNMDGSNGHSAHLDIIVSDIKCEMNIEEDSFFEKSIAKTVLAHEAADRIIEILTNKKYLYSEALGRTDIGYQNTGVNTGALTGLSHGFWIRGFDELPVPTDQNPNPFKPLTTSLKDFIASFSTMWNLGLGIETIGNSECVRIESLNYFYNRNVTIKLPNQVKDIKRSVTTDKVYSNIELGYEKGGDYEEAFGLDEYNSVSKFATCIKRINNIFLRKSKYRADSYGKEFARRKPKSRYATQDTRYDNDVFVHDLKKGPTSVYQERKWQDDFAQAPTGTFSPDTATNLRLSPMNLLLRHGRFVASCLQKNINEFTRYISSTGNSQLKTKLIGGVEYAENGDIINSELGKPRYTYEIIEFKHHLDFNIIRALDGHSIINGKKIQNLYGRIEFINENNEKEYGYLLNCKYNDGSFKLLKAI